MTELNQSAGAPSYEHRADGEINLLDLAVVLAEYKKLVVGLPLAACVIAMLFILLTPKIYTGTTRMMPPQQNQSAATALLGLHSLERYDRGSNHRTVQAEGTFC